MLLLLLPQWHRSNTLSVDAESILQCFPRPKCARTLNRLVSGGLDGDGLYELRWAIRAIQYSYGPTWRQGRKVHQNSHGGGMKSGGADSMTKGGPAVDHAVRAARPHLPGRHPDMDILISSEERQTEP